MFIVDRRRCRRHSRHICHIRYYCHQYRTHMHNRIHTRKNIIKLWNKKKTQTLIIIMMLSYIFYCYCHNDGYIYICVKQTNETVPVVDRKGKKGNKLRQTNDNVHTSQEMVENLLIKNERESL